MKPEDLRYRDTHEWVYVEEGGDGKQVTVGISKFAVEELKDLVFLELPQPGKELKAGDEFGEVESVKAVSPLYSPVDLEVTEVNKDLPDNLDKLSEDPFGEGWMIKGKLQDESGLEKLMDFAAYQKQCEEESH